MNLSQNSIRELIHANCRVNLSISGSRSRFDSTFTSFAVYIIEVKIGDYNSTIFRRFNQFYQLDIEIRQKWPKETIPQLPKKTFFRSKVDKELVALRSKHLQQYLAHLTQIDKIVNSEIFIKWLSPTHNPLFVSLDSPDLTGVLLKQGHVVRNWKERFFVLKDDLLYYFRSRDEITPLGVVPLANSMVENAEKNRELCIKISPRSLRLQPFFICTFSHDDYLIWYEKLKSACLKYSKMINTNVNTHKRASSTTKLPFPTSLTIISPRESTNNQSYSTINYGDQNKNSNSNNNINNKNHNNNNNNNNKPKIYNKSNIIKVNSSHNLIKRNSLNKLDGEKIAQSYSESRTGMKINIPERHSININSLSCSTDSPLSQTNIQPLNRSFDSSKRKKRLNHMKFDYYEELYQTKQVVDDQLMDFLSSINFAIVKERFLDTSQKKSLVTTDFFEKIKNLATTFLQTEVNDLCQPNYCKSIFYEVQMLTIEFPDERFRKYTTTFLFIISPISRTVALIRVDSKKKKEINFLDKPTDSLILRSPRSQFKNLLNSSLIDCIQLVGLSMGISLEKTLKENSTKTLPSNLLIRKTKSRDQSKVNSNSNLNLHQESSSDFQWLLNSAQKKDQKKEKENSVISVTLLCTYCNEEINLHFISQHERHCSISKKIFKNYQIGESKDISLLHSIMIEYLNSLDKIIENEYEEKRKSSNLIYFIYLTQNIANYLASLVSTEIIPIEIVENLLENIKEEEKYYYFIDQLNRFITSSKSAEDFLHLYAIDIRSILVESSNLFTQKKSIENSPIDLKIELTSPDPPSKSHSESQQQIQEIENQRVTIHSFELIKPISSGAFGRVDLVKLKGEDTYFAMKTLKKKDMIDKNLVEQVITERNILATTSNPYVVRMYYAFHDIKKLYLLMEYLNGGDCASLLENIHYFSEEMAKCYIAETIMAISYLHSKGIVHRDVKPDNMLITSDGHIKLTDFGLSKVGFLERNPNDLISNTNEISNTPIRRDRKSFIIPRAQRVVGTPDYLSPEALMGTGAGKSVDWWAVGITLFEFLTGIPPFNDDSPEKIFQNILRRDLQWPSIPDEMSEEAHDLIDKLLAYDASKRLGSNGVEEIKSHPFFRDINWDTLYKEPRLFVPRTKDKLDTSYFTQRVSSDLQSFVTNNNEVNFHEEEDDQFAGFSWNSYPSVEILQSAERFAQSQ